MVYDQRIRRHMAEFTRFIERSKREFEERLFGRLSPNGEMSDFLLLRTLGTGSFGRVMLARHKTRSDRYYALKLLDKRHVIKTRQLDHVHNEIRLLDATNFEFLIHLEFFFKDNCYVILGMQFVNGGEMFTHLRNAGKFDEAMAKFYMAQVVLALDYLHMMGLVYRDLKPENIMLDKEGYIKLTDFGFCKKIDNSRTWTLCGTPEYLAPEVILSQGYNRSVDWWSAGILMYELVAGYPPFYAKDHMRLYDKIVRGKFHIPVNFSKTLQNLIGNMLKVDRSKRYGCMRNGSLDVKTHDWFTSIDWDAIWQRKVRPSYRPRVYGADDYSNFDAYAEEPLRVNSEEEYKFEFEEITLRHVEKVRGKKDREKSE